ncbi:MAG: hypothetical protein J0L82_04340 [Deltaproteobacteria bacterium]|nr:hypothetical protein [Deltaproteobacteria bacterium]
MARNRAVVAILFIAAFAEIFSTSVAIASCPDGFAELGSGNAGDRGQFISPVFGSYGEVILRKLIPVGDERVVVFINYPGLRASSADLEIH